MYDFPVKGVHTDVSGKFSIRRERILSPDGSPVGDVPSVAARKDTLVSLYRAMALTRAFDKKAVELQRTGRLGTFASSLGQEAVGVGVAAAMTPSDVLLPSFREQAAQLWRGVSIVELLLYWGGDERGSDFATPRQDFPVSIPVASHLLHAAGVARAFQLREEKRCAVAIAGDGATSKGDFYEAINLAGAWQLPIVFVINNNGWAISVPRESQTAAKTLAQKGIAAGIPGVQVDGNDVLAVEAICSAATAHARIGSGPVLVEALTYRLGDHTTADDASRYRDDEQVSEHWKEEPLLRVRLFLTQQFGWTKEEEHALIDSISREIDAAVESYLNIEAQPAMAMFDFLYENPPEEILAQRTALEHQLSAGADD